MKKRRVKKAIKRKLMSLANGKRESICGEKIYKKKKYGMRESMKESRKYGKVCRYGYENM